MILQARAQRDVFPTRQVRRFQNYPFVRIQGARRAHGDSKLVRSGGEDGLDGFDDAADDGVRAILGLGG